MPIKIKKKKKSVRMRGTATHGWGFRKKHKGSGHRGGVGMAGTGKRADQKKTLINKLYGNKYFGKRNRGITSLSLKKDRSKVINLREIEKKFDGKNEIDLSEYKILGEGEINKKFIIKAKLASKSAIDKVKKAGGEIILPIKKEKPKIEEKQKSEEEPKKEKEEEKITENK